MYTWPLILRELQILNKYSKNTLIPVKTIGQGVHKMSTKQARKLQATLDGCNPKLTYSQG